MRLTTHLTLVLLVGVVLGSLGMAPPAHAATNPIDMGRYGMIWTQTLNGTPTETFTSLADVYLNGGLDVNGKKLALGYYYVMITADLNGLNKIASSYPSKPISVTSQGVFQQAYKLLGTGGIFPAIGIQKDVYYYVWISRNPFTSPPCYAEVDRCRFLITGGETASSGLIAYKFRDMNWNGQWDPFAPNNEPPLQYWQIQVFDANNILVDSQFTDVNGKVAFLLNPGTYTVKEVMQAGWVATTDTEFIVTVPEDGMGGPVYFGNAKPDHQISCSYAAPVYYWYSEKGKAKFMADESGNLAALCALNLVDADGNPFDPVDYPSVARWMANAYYTNDAYALSVQLASMVLSIRAGFAKGDAVVFNSTLGFITLADLIAAADAALAADGYTPVGDPNRAAQDVLRKTLAAANNNFNFVTTP